MDTISPRFARCVAARNAGAFVLGVLSALESKNCWTMVELSGHDSPDNIAAPVVPGEMGCRRHPRRCAGPVIKAFAEPDGILVVDETGDLKKGTNTVVVQRRHSGTAERIENCQVAVYDVHHQEGHALIDRALYLPRSWTYDPDRCAEGGVPGGVGFATKPVLATAMIECALDAGVSVGWVAGDEVYGADRVCEQQCRTKHIGYVLAISCDRRVPTDRLRNLTRPKAVSGGLAGGGWYRAGAAEGSFADDALRVAEFVTSGDQ